MMTPNIAEDFISNTALTTSPNTAATISTDIIVRMQSLSLSLHDAHETETENEPPEDPSYFESSTMMSEGYIEYGIKSLQDEPSLDSKAQELMEIKLKQTQRDRGFVDDLKQKLTALQTCFNLETNPGELSVDECKAVLDARRQAVEALINEFMSTDKLYNLLRRRKDLEAEIASLEDRKNRVEQYLEHSEKRTNVQIEVEQLDESSMDIEHAKIACEEEARALKGKTQALNARQDGHADRSLR